MCAMTRETPHVALDSLDVLWFQVAGTICNLTCRHCFISCSPTNKTFGFLALETVENALKESVSYGVKEYYFTGGEPFLNPALVPMLERTLQFGPVTVLTNGTVLKEEWLKRLRAAVENSTYSLEFRVSIDGPDAERNDPIRGDRTFERALQGIRKLCEFGFLPIITMTQTWEDDENEEVLAKFRQVLREVGHARPRLKILPRIRIGAEAERTCGYGELERITPEMMEGFDQSQLLCSYSRVVTDRGVAVCPILLDSPEALLGATLGESTEAFPLAHGACYTCYQFGSICTNPSTKRQGHG
ncbi:radical SAM protein [Rubinisphaera margarita]|uniref:radical SAM protein n=1 Tax=Rubinisphaera margarita TaxID=2909586 RepID=UPI001EE93E86|nr:radical SAM protein [Rubinisphaera margarita]MCG6154221.1 radical SAM protein [Rubinisphaera margarita]